MSDKRLNEQNTNSKNYFEREETLFKKNRVTKTQKLKLVFTFALSKKIRRI